MSPLMFRSYRLVPPPEPPDLADGVRYLTAWDVPMPGPHDPVVFGPDPLSEEER